MVPSSAVDLATRRAAMSEGEGPPSSKGKEEAQSESKDYSLDKYLTGERGAGLTDIMASARETNESSSSTTKGVSKSTLIMAILIRGHLPSCCSGALCGMSVNELEFYTENENHKGYECLRAGEFKDALLHFHWVLESLEAGENESFGVKVHYNIALCLVHLGSYKDAEHHCNLALREDPSGERTSTLLHKKCWSCLGKLAYRQGWFGDAMSHFETALELEPNN